jgi:PKD repeat protein
MMKNKIKSGLVALMTIFLLTACSQDEHSLGAIDTVAADQVSFNYTTSSTSDNVLTFTNTSNVNIPHSVLWDLGNGTTSKDKNPRGEYPMAGDYTVSLTLYAADGSAATKSQVIHIANNDFGLIDTPAYRNLTGGMDDADGKIWVFDQYNNFTKEVKEALDKDIRGHIGLGEPGSYSQGWWGAGPNEKGAWTMYDMKFTFIQNDVQLKIQTDGQGYGRNALAAAGGFSVTAVEGEDAVFNYAGGSYNFSLSEGGKYPILTLSGNAFMGYYVGSQSYEIIYQTDEVMALYVNNPVEGQDWIFIYCLEDLNVSTPPIVKQLKEVPLSENFESATPSVVFTPQDMGAKYAVSYQNPAPVPVNESDKVLIYQKTDAFYSNISYTTIDYLFDLSKVNKIRMKVYIPSYNDYDHDYAVAGDWITNKRLLSQVAVKLQDSTKGDSAWETQTEIVKADLTKDKWLSLEFDFSSVSNSTDYDKIVIQFGAEGHAAPGIFFLDDFSFSE